jgi:hypothetical protein
VAQAADSKEQSTPACHSALHSRGRAKLCTHHLGATCGCDLPRSATAVHQPGMPASVCPCGHPLRARTQPTHLCDSCHQATVGTAARCEICNIDVCALCAAAAASTVMSTTATTTTTAGSSAWSSPAAADSVVTPGAEKGALTASQLRIQRTKLQARPMLFLHQWALRQYWRLPLHLGLPPPAGNIDRISATLVGVTDFRNRFERTYAVHFPCWRCTAASHLCGRMLIYVLRRDAGAALF